MPKRQHRSGLTGEELFQAVIALEALLNKGRLEQKANAEAFKQDSDDAQEDVADDEDSELSQVEAVLKMLKSKGDGPQGCATHCKRSYLTSETLNQGFSFSGITLDQLERMNFFLSGILYLKPDTASRLAEVDALGTDGLWSLDMLCRHLVFLDGLVPRNVCFDCAQVDPQRSPHPTIVSVE